MPSLIRRRHLSYALRGGTWRHLGRRARWLAAPGVAPAVPLSWPVAELTRETLSIRWPRHYGWSNAGGWIDPIKRGISAHVALAPADIPQPVGNVVLFHVAAGADTLRAVIDYDDRLDLHDCAAEVDLYFKLQHSREGYGNGVVRPGGYVSKHPALYRYARDWRALRARSTPTLDVLGRFGLKWAQDIRRQAIALLLAQDRVRFQGGTTPIWWGEYMDEICQARVCLDLPGNGEFCYRLVEYLATGACIVGPELLAEMPVPLESGVHLVRVPRTLDGLVDWCDRLVNDDGLRSDIRRRAGDYFDRYLALDQLGAYYVDCMWRAISPG